MGTKFSSSRNAKSSAKHNGEYAAKGSAKARAASGSKSPSDQVPARFPAGTRYVIEGQNGRIHLRYLEFPDGRVLALPTDPGPEPRRDRCSRGAKRSPEKNLAGVGTTPQLAS